MSEEEGIFQLTNYKDHPTNNLYKVFFFSEKERADYFEALLQERGIEYETGEDTYRDTPLYLFGVHRSVFKEALNCNFLTIAKFRKPFFGTNIWARLLIVVFCIALLSIAVIGYYTSQ